MSLKAKLIAVFCVLMMLGIAAGSIGLLASKMQTDATNTIIAERIPIMAASKDLETNFGDVRLAYLKELVAVDAESRSAAGRAIETSSREFNSSLSKYSDLIQASARKSAVDEIASDFGAYSKLGAQFLDMVNKGMQSGPAKLYSEQMEPIGEKIRASVTNVISLNAQE